MGVYARPMSVHRPVAALRPFVQVLWAREGVTAHSAREHVLPGGGMHLAIRLDGSALRLFRDADDVGGELVGAAVVAGARSRFYAKQAPATASVGVVLHAGAAQALLGCAAHELAGHHVPLDAVWTSADVMRLQERLVHACDARRRVGILQAALLARLQPMRAMHPAVAQSLASLDRGARVTDVVGLAGFSHRHFIERFRQATGLAPKEYARVRRFRRAMRGLARGHALDDLALEAGYSDQAHLQREFRQMAGMTPCQYRRAGTRGLHVAQVNYVQDRHGASV